MNLAQRYSVILGNSRNGTGMSIIYQLISPFKKKYIFIDVTLKKNFRIQTVYDHQHRTDRIPTAMVTDIF